MSFSLSHLLDGFVSVLLAIPLALSSFAHKILPTTISTTLTLPAGILLYCPRYFVMANTETAISPQHGLKVNTDSPSIWSPATTTKATIVVVMFFLTFFSAGYNGTANIISKFTPILEQATPTFTWVVVIIFGTIHLLVPAPVTTRILIFLAAILTAFLTILPQVLEKLPPILERATPILEQATPILERVSPTWVVVVVFGTIHLSVPASVTTRILIFLAAILAAFLTILPQVFEKLPPILEKLPPILEKLPPILEKMTGLP
ncbi:hypothetical protein B0T25DRAFT_576245 [Lasiosphaeria hispida]|uniref:Uncharacterized protein n=1 Tax=Lasiosphaeria hispida TaxID=260671 RepID=A0AAJ0MKL5_9PEZI|nr:hypothetical protein B0T25DRAFT_576245 [Lasiosphaeria hispida]